MLADLLLSTKRLELRFSQLVLSTSLLAAALPAHALAWCQMTTSDLRPSPAEPCILAVNHPGEFPLAWRRRCTSVALSTEEEAEDLSDAVVRDVLARSIASWESVLCDGSTGPGLDIQVLAETTLADRARHFASGRNVNAIIFVRSGWVDVRGHDSRALAVTYVWHDPGSGEIYDADIELNEIKIFTVCPDSGCPGAVDTETADLENTLTHELGHYFGVAHTPDDTEATMWAEASPGETLKRTLAADDIAGICAIYPPGSLPAACSYTPRGGFGLDARPPSGCGCRITSASVGSVGPWGAFPVRELSSIALAGLALALRRRRPR